MGNSPAAYEAWRQAALEASGEDIVTVSVGGSRKATPLPDGEWKLIRYYADLLLQNTVGKPSFSTLGDSTWNGIAERSYVVSVLSPDLSKIANLREGLRNLAATFGQDAIALTVGKSSLLSG